jgi:5-methylcytosine-specific restriction endonuclease McrA
MAFSDETILAVWRKAQIVNGYDSTKWRKDQCGAWICWDYYGNRNNLYGWEIDHITPVSKGGSDNLSNLRPLQWKNNASRQDDRLYCVITSQGNKNVEK